jgi:hypothetical protein
VGSIQAHVPLHVAEQQQVPNPELKLVEQREQLAVNGATIRQDPPAPHPDPIKRLLQPSAVLHPELEALLQLLPDPGDP